jgi:hypothetical protein
MKHILTMILGLFFTIPALSFDLSTHENGNLYQPDRDAFIPSEITIYDDASILQESGLTLVNNRIYPQGEFDGSVDYDIPDLHSGSNISGSKDGYRVELIGNSDRYYHPILGSADNATGFRVMKGNDLVSTYSLKANQVFETKRALITDIVPENQGYEIVLTVSDDNFGARMEVYSLEGKQLGVSEFVGRSHRWMHLLAVAPFTDLPLMEQGQVQLALIQTPHIGGILKLYQWNETKLERINQQSGFSTHAIGSDNLNMAIAANFDDQNDIELLLPSQDFTSLKLVKYIDGNSKIIKTFKLPGRLDTNLYLTNNGENAIWLAISNGKIVKISATP